MKGSEQIPKDTPSNQLNKFSQFSRLPSVPEKPRLENPERNSHMAFKIWNVRNNHLENIAALVSEKENEYKLAKRAQS